MSPRCRFSVGSVWLRSVSEPTLDLLRHQEKGKKTVNQNQEKTIAFPTWVAFQSIVKIETVNRYYDSLLYLERWKFQINETEPESKE